MPPLFRFKRMYLYGGIMTAYFRRYVHTAIVLAVFRIFERAGKVELVRIPDCISDIRDRQAGEL